MSWQVAVDPPDQQLEAVVKAVAGTLSDIGRASGVVVSEMSTATLTTVVERAPGLRWVQLRSAGIEPLVGSPITATLVARGITLTNAAGIYGRNVAEHALGLVLGLGRNLFLASRSGAWSTLSAGRTLFGQRVCIVGAGGIGRSLLDLLAPFGCQTTIVRRSTATVPGAARTLALEDLHLALADAQVVVVACPLTPQTWKMFDGKAFAQMRQRPLLVNVGRGAVVDTDALRTALAEGLISGAALDVTDPEPLPPEDSLWKLSNVIITPHTANDKALGEGAYYDLVADNVGRFINEGTLVNVVAPEHLLAESGSLMRG